LRWCGADTEYKTKSVCVKRTQLTSTSTLVLIGFDRKYFKNNNVYDERYNKDEQLKREDKRQQLFGVFITSL
jgi:uncharacterized protein YvpB